MNSNFLLTKQRGWKFEKSVLLPQKLLLMSWFTIWTFLNIIMSLSMDFFLLILTKIANLVDAPVVFAFVIIYLKTKPEWLTEEFFLYYRSSLEMKFHLILCGFCEIDVNEWFYGGSRFKVNSINMCTAIRLHWRGKCNETPSGWEVGGGMRIKRLWTAWNRRIEANNPFGVRFALRDIKV